MTKKFFILADACCLVDLTVRIFGEQTYRNAVKVAEYMTGMTAPDQSDPEFEVWYPAAMHASRDSVLDQLAEQYPAVGPRAEGLRLLIVQSKEDRSVRIQDRAKYIKDQIFKMDWDFHEQFELEPLGADKVEELRAKLAPDSRYRRLLREQFERGLECMAKVA